MLVLALDCAGSACSVALLRDAQVLAWRHAVMARGQSEVLVPMIRDVMAAAGLDLAAVDVLAATVGPGAFTGIRIGLATARALALALGKPLAGISTTDAIAAAVDDPAHPVMVVVDSRRAELWVQLYDAALAPQGPILALLPDQVAALVTGPVILAGDGAALVAPLLPGAVLAQNSGHIDAVQVARLAVRRWPHAVLPPEPLYLRDADVTMPKAVPQAVP